MSIDERLVTLTHSIELLAEMQRDNEKRYDARFLQLTDAIMRLSGRLSDLEGQQ